MENSETGTTEQLPDPAPRFKGHSIDLGGRVYIVPPLTLRQVGDLESKMAAIEGLTENTPAGEYFDAVLEIILPAMRRNYPTLTRDALDDAIDLNNVWALVRAATGRPDPAAQ